MQNFKNEAEFKAYKAHILGMATERFDALGLGPRTPQMVMTRLPMGPYSNPSQAAFDGIKFIAIGSPGTGKSTGSGESQGLCPAQAQPAVTDMYPAMLDKFKSKDVGEYMAWLTGGDVLVLDDLDKLQGTQYEAERMLIAINHYDVNNLPILATMNIELDQFVSRVSNGGAPSDYANAIISRLRSRASIHLVDGEDHRKLA